MIDPTTTLGALVTLTPAAARVLERHGLDYCCGGEQGFGDACAAAGIDPTRIDDEIAALAIEPTPDWAAMGPTELVDHLEATHHAYLGSELPRLSALVEKVESVHGDRHPELHEVRAAFETLRADLEPHLMKEERVLFPMVRELDGADEAPQFHCGTLGNPIGVMRGEHDLAGATLAELRRLTDGYVPPEDGCASYQMLYEGLAGLETDTHLHVHKENNVLFPAVAEMEAAKATTA